MANKTAICNMALTHLQVSRFISNVDTDVTQEAKVCRVWFEAAHRFLQRDYDWNFNRRYQALALLGSEASIQSGLWGYKYAYPSDCMMIRAIVTPGTRLPIKGTRIPYEVATENDASNNDIKVIYSDQPNAILRFSKYVANTEVMDAHSTVAMSYLLATYIASPLSANAKLALEAKNAYVGLRDSAIKHDAEESEEGSEPDNESLVYRGYHG